MQLFSLRLALCVCVALFICSSCAQSLGCGKAVEAQGCTALSGKKSVTSVPTQNLKTSTVVSSSTTTATSTPSTTVTAKIVTKTKTMTITQTASGTVFITTTSTAPTTNTTTLTEVTRVGKRALTLEKRATSYPIMPRA